MTTAAVPDRHRLRRVLLMLSVPAVVLILMVANVTTAQSAVHHARSQHRSTATVRRANQPPWAPVLGVYAGPGEVAGAKSFDVQARGPVPYALDFIESSSWSSISDPRWTLKQWKDSKFHMIFGVPMLPTQGATLAAGSMGAYNAHFEALATALVAAGDGNAVLMIGWDPLQAGTSWQVTNKTEATEYVRYWRDIAETMHGVSGANFLFEWDGGTPASLLATPSVYPGDAVVNLIATNVFDQVTTPSTMSRWNAVSSGDDGADWFAQFALEHRKPLVIGEWGLVPASTSGGGGDDVAFVKALLSWSKANHVAMLVTWDYGTWDITSGSFSGGNAALDAQKNTGGSSSAVRALEGQQPGT